MNRKPDKESRLDKELNVDKLSLCVPDCKLLAEIPEEDRGEKCASGTRLYGKVAIQHARNVHQKIHRRALRYPPVIAIDIGFAAKEGSKEFTNTLSIRAHVVNKISKAELEFLARPDLTSVLYVCEGHATLPLLASRRAAHLRKYNQTHIESNSGETKAFNQTTLDVATNTQSQLPFNFENLYANHPFADAEDITFGPVDNVRSETDSSQTTRLSSLSRSSFNECLKFDKDDYRIHICGVPLDIIQAEYFPAAGVFTEPLQNSAEMSAEEMEVTGRSRINTLIGGISIGNTAGQAGTLGAVVWDRTDGTPCILSNFHVLSGTLPATVGQPCYQPALFDGGSSSDIAGRLKRWILNDDGDAALAQVDEDKTYASGEIAGMWHPVAGIRKPELNMKVHKWGRTTGFTRGFIDGIDLATNIDYGNGVIRFFKDQIHIAPLYRDSEFSQVGDSGSLVLTSENFRKIKKREERYNKIVKACAEIIRDLRANKGELTEGSVKNRCIEGKLPNSICTALGLKSPDPEDSSKNGAIYKSSSETESSADDAENFHKCDPREIQKILIDLGLNPDLLQYKKEDQEDRRKERAYFAVGMLFAGEVAGSQFGEFALASDIKKLAETLDFSLRPVFEPRGSFRLVREHSRSNGTASLSDQTLTPGGQTRDERGTGPTPTPEPASGSPRTSGGGSGPSINRKG